MSATFEEKYIQWVQRTLNRDLDSDLVTNGRVTAEYREAVETFQLKHDLRITGLVDREDQDTMIKVNHKTRSYVNWLQEALRASGVDSSLAITGVVDEKTKKCVKSFQAFHNLTDDGWVGAKTESELIESSGILPGGHLKGVRPIRRPLFYDNPTPTNNAIPVEQAVNRIISSNYTYVLHNADEMSADSRRTRLCVLGKLKQRHGILDTFPYDFWLDIAHSGSKQFNTAESVFVSAREYLTNKVARWPSHQRLNVHSGRLLVIDLMKEIEHGLERLSRYARESKSSPSASFGPLLAEILAMVEVRKQKPNSILHCFRT
ncbi:MAG: peptidoglycan-binding protein [Planctomyces sp.]|nr:peptidoglycan-binding protein [Planctomyces sp.]